MAKGNKVEWTVGTDRSIETATVSVKVKGLKRKPVAVVDVPTDFRGWFAGLSNTAAQSMVRRYFVNRATSAVRMAHSYREGTTNLSDLNIFPLVRMATAQHMSHKSKALAGNWDDPGTGKRKSVPALSRIMAVLVRHKVVTDAGRSTDEMMERYTLLDKSKAKMTFGEFLARIDA